MKTRVKMPKKKKNRNKLQRRAFQTEQLVYQGPTVGGNMAFRESESRGEREQS